MFVLLTVKKLNVSGPEGETTHGQVRTGKSHNLGNTTDFLVVRMGSENIAPPAGLWQEVQQYPLPRL